MGRADHLGQKGSHSRKNSSESWEENIPLLTLEIHDVNAV